MTSTWTAKTIGRAQAEDEFREAHEPAAELRVAEITRRRLELLWIQAFHFIVVTNTPGLGVPFDVARRRNPIWPWLVLVDVETKRGEARLANDLIAQAGSCVVLPSSILDHEELGPKYTAPGTHVRSVDVRQASSRSASLVPFGLLLGGHTILVNLVGEVRVIRWKNASLESEVIVYAFTRARWRIAAKRADLKGTAVLVKLAFSGATSMTGWNFRRFFGWYHDSRQRKVTMSDRCIGQSANLAPPPLLDTAGTSVLLV